MEEGRGLECITEKVEEERGVMEKVKEERGVDRVVRQIGEHITNTGPYLSFVLNNRYKYLSITFPKLASSYILPHQSLPTPVPSQRKCLREAIVGYASDYGVVIIKLCF